MLDHEDFANICLRIKKKGDSMAIPCCGNCKYYRNDLLPGVKRDIWSCNHPRLFVNGIESKAWLVLQPEDFCSRYEERSEY